ncbi:hypothetical protein [Nostoc sp.]
MVLTVSWAVEAIARLGGYRRISKQNTNWYPGTVARLVKITRPLCSRSVS